MLGAAGRRVPVFAANRLLRLIQQPVDLALKSVTYHETYGTIYGMQKTTVYLPDDLKAALARAAADTGRSEADLIREGIWLAVARSTPPEPTIPILVSEDPTFAERAEQLLRGFGER